MSLIIHAVSPDHHSIRSICGVLIDGVSATGHHPPIEPRGDMPACGECIALTEDAPRTRTPDYPYLFGRAESLAELAINEAADAGTLPATIRFMRERLDEIRSQATA
ncbi:hypothetical protein [Aeromicrobium sp. UC242_57]|uniref:hypothetical protein n=1 Tax=Aeromicrobium sp. UC242_57 TaxID=3374624 RepID=UPI00379C81A6